MVSSDQTLTGDLTYRQDELNKVVTEPLFDTLVLGPPCWVHHVNTLVLSRWHRRMLQKALQVAQMADGPTRIKGRLGAGTPHNKIAQTPCTTVDSRSTARYSVSSRQARQQAQASNQDQFRQVVADEQSLTGTKSLAKLLTDARNAVD